MLGAHVTRLLFGDGVVRDIQYVPGQVTAPLVAPLNDPNYFDLK